MQDSNREGGAVGVAAEVPSVAAAVAMSFWSRVDRSAGPDGCWPWTGAIEKTGYGRVYFAGKARFAHRVAYALAHGAMPAPGLQVDHVRDRGCRRCDCCNPAHLEAVTQHTNILRGTSPHVVLHNLRVCAQGHRVEGANRKLRRGNWCCRICYNADRAAWRARRRERAAS